MKDGRNLAVKKTCCLRFYAELNDFLPNYKRYRPFDHELFGTPAVKDIIESLGIPHTEVDLLLINSIPAPFSQHVHPGDFISVFPAFKSLDISETSKVKTSYQNKPLFAIDVHLGKLAISLKMLGFNCAYKNNFSDDELIKIAENENRIILTRDTELLKQNHVTHGYYVRSTERLEQVIEVLHRFDLYDSISPFTRCLECNDVLEKVEKQEVKEYLPDKVRKNFTEFHRCPKCGKIFWKGTHYEKMKVFISEVKNKGFHSNPNDF